MMSQVNSRFRFVGKGSVVAFAVLCANATSALAQSESTGDSWGVGSAAHDDTSVGLAATVNVPAPGGKGQVIQHSTDSVAGTPPQPDARRPLEPPPSYSEPAPAQAQAADYEDADPSALDAFRSDLDPYGRWVDDSKYGRVWVPDAGYVGSDFAPYVSNGHWGADADNNWVWMSDYPFGWVVFHYGRWVWIDSVGWSWVPGRRYAPAWVVWRVPTDDYAYVGWAPAPPYYAWYGTGVYWFSYYPPLPFVFCPSAYLFYPHFGAYLVRDRYFAGTLVRHSAWYSTGPVYGRGYSSPTFARARVPANAVPSQRVSADPRALSMSRPSANPSITGRGSSARLSSVNPAGAGLARNPSTGFGTRPANMSPGASRPSTVIGSSRYGGSPSFRSNSTAGGIYANGFSSRPRPLVERSSPYQGRQTQTLGSLPSSSYASPRSSGSYSSPRYSSPSSSWSAPRYSSPSSYSSPRYSSPSSSYSAPRYSAPSSSFSAPRYSAPSSSYSAPSHSFSSGSSGHSFSGGGGGFRSGGGGGFRSGGGGGRHR